MERSSDWQLALDVADEAAYAVLAHDRIWNCFAIADLEPPFRAFARYAVAQRRDPPRWAACLVLRHPAFAVVAPSGDRDGLARIFEQIDLPARTLIQAHSDHKPLVERYYRFLSPGREMVRMAVTASTLRASTDQSHARPERLTPDDAEALAALYALFPTSMFRRDELEHGVYYGIRAGDRIVAAGGTHALAPRYGIAVLGNVFTHPDVRGQGYAHAVVAALVADLIDRGCCDVALNVFADNGPAIGLYAGLGFVEHLRYWVLEGDRHDA
jgi:ribosomal protein S18 acetylase RimI-like enzyme